MGQYEVAAPVLKRSLVLTHVDLLGVISTAGPDHTKTFEMSAVIRKRVFPPAWGKSKKEAEQRAARAALHELGLL